MIVKLLTEHHLEFPTLKKGCRGSSESTHVKMPHCLKSHALAHMVYVLNLQTLVACKESLDKQCRTRSDWRSSLIRASLFAILTSVL